MSADRDLLSDIHRKAAQFLAVQILPCTDETKDAFEAMEEIWEMTQEAWDQVHGPSGDDGRDFTAPYEP